MCVGPAHALAAKFAEMYSPQIVELDVFHNLHCLVRYIVLSRQIVPDAGRTSTEYDSQGPSRRYLRPPSASASADSAN
jgi:hypothetical protein